MTEVGEPVVWELTTPTFTWWQNEVLSCEKPVIIDVYTDDCVTCTLENPQIIGQVEALNGNVKLVSANKDKMQVMRATMEDASDLKIDKCMVVPGWRRIILMQGGLSVADY